MTEYITANQLAKEIGVTRFAISNYFKSGVIPKSLYFKEGIRYKINKDAAIAAISAYKDSNKRSQSLRKDKLIDKKPKKVKTANDIAPPIGESRQLEAYYKALQEKHNYEVLKGKWCLNSDVEKEVFDAWRNLRDNLMSLIPQLSAVLAAENDKRVIEEMLNDKFRDILEGANKWV